MKLIAYPQTVNNHGPSYRAAEIVGLESSNFVRVRDVSFGPNGQVVSNPTAPERAYPIADCKLIGLGNKGGPHALGDWWLLNKKERFTSDNDRQHIGSIGRISHAANPTSASHFCVQHSGIAWKEGECFYVESMEQLTRDAVERSLGLKKTNEIAKTEEKKETTTVEKMETKDMTNNMTNNDQKIKDLEAQLAALKANTPKTAMSAITDTLMKGTTEGGKQLAVRKANKKMSSVLRRGLMNLGLPEEMASSEMLDIAIRGLIPLILSGALGMYKGENLPIPKVKIKTATMLNIMQRSFADFTETEGERVLDALLPFVTELFKAYQSVMSEEEETETPSRKVTAADLFTVEDDDEEKVPVHVTHTHTAG